MVKKIGYFFVALIILLALAGGLGIRWFNNMWFEEKPKYLSFTSDNNPIEFEWAEETFGDYFEPHYAILIPVKIGDLSNKFYFQFDTGAPSTLLYGNPLKSLKETDLNITEFTKANTSFVENIDLSLGGNRVNMTTIQILEDYGSTFELSDTSSAIKIGTIGADFMDDRITMIDFKNQSIQIYMDRPEWMTALENFKPFDFKGRRFMLPAIIDGKELELFYDSGSSSFGLITSKNRYDTYTDETLDEIKFNANRFGDPIPIHHRDTDKSIEIGGLNLGLKRVSYVNMYANYQKLMTPFTKIGGWLGNKPFIESTLIFDTQKQEFIVLQH